MLVLTRKPGEKIVIGEHISLMIVEVSRGKVRVGIDAPREITIDREEINEAKNGLPSRVVVAKKPKPTVSEEVKPEPIAPTQPPLGQHFHRRLRANLASGRAASETQENPNG